MGGMRLKMKKNDVKNKKIKNKEQRHYDKGQIFVKVSSFITVWHIYNAQ